MSRPVRKTRPSKRRAPKPPVEAPAPAPSPVRPDRTCDRCERERHYCPENKKLCYRHYVEEYCPIDFVFHRDVPAWAIEALQEEALHNRLANQWNPGKPYVVVHVFSRREAHTPLWKERWERSASHLQKQHDKPWAYRGFCEHFHGKIVLIVDDVGVETRDSLQWIFWHELGHMAVSEMDLIDNTFMREDDANRVHEKARELGWNDDIKHEALSEEIFVNRIATSIVGQDLNRLWFRTRANAYLDRGAVEPSPAEAAS